MGYANYDTVCMAWVDMVLGRTSKRPPKNERMYCSNGGDELYSYGSHFTLVQAQRDRKGVVTGFLLNGDRYSNTTSGHQATVRNAIARTGYPSVIVPFEALHSASIDLDTVEIVDVLPDRVTLTTHTFTEVQPGWQWRDDEVSAYRDKTREELQARADEITKREMDQWEQHQRWADEDPESYWAKTRRPAPEPHTVEMLDHWERDQQVRYVREVERNLYTSSRWRAQQVDITIENGEPVYSYETRRHWLGESLIRAKVYSFKTIKCPVCGGTGLPAPDFTHNDRFNNQFVPTGCHHCVRGTGLRSSGRKTVESRRTALFLSGFDHNETRDVYFFSELASTKPRTVDEAYESLKPDTVKLAEQMGREVLRQGDIFAVPMPGMDKRTLRGMGATFERRGTLLKTNHVATEVAYLKDGRTLARGTLTHDPDFRGPDHKRVKMPHNVWHLTVKNTVPLTK